jgi:hypothetical protein
MYALVTYIPRIKELAILKNTNEDYCVLHSRTLCTFFFLKNSFYFTLAYSDVNFKQFRPGVVAHTCNPSYLGG